ncbi:MAG: hypothetical protein Q9M17_02295 [Mariprofundus sp.]|nr:hypothetical protein [Mariprofundus sp.]
MPDMEKNNNMSDSTLIDKEHCNSSLDDGDMSESMSESKGNATTILRYMAISFVIGTLVFIVMAYSLQYFQMHHGSSFFDHHSGNQ